MVERRTFYSDGLKLVGYLRVPEGIRDGEKRSAIVLCGGFGAHQERFLPEMADYLSSQGYVTFTFDYRGFGESEGPRWRMIPQEQVKDIANAITFLENQDVVNSEMIGLLGVSFGGANVCYLAGVDTRVACVVSVVGVGCGEKWLRSLRRAWEWRGFLKELDEDRKQRVLDGSSRVVDRLYIMLADPNTAEMTQVTLQRYPETCTEMPLETADAVINFHPEDVVGDISPRGALFIVAAEDNLVENENTRELYDLAEEPKRWVELEGCQHYDAYASPHFERVMEESTAWYRRFIPSEVE